jgi:hypothetical protein
MAHVITFRTSKFDPTTETPNPINPIAGESVLTWLSGQLRKSGYQATSPAAEGWGWYVDVSGNPGAYLLGASADAQESAASVEWTIQIHKHRSVVDKLTGRNKMLVDDPLAARVEQILRADPDIKDVEVEAGP